MAIDAAADHPLELGDHPVELLVVDGDDALEQIEVVAGVLGDANEGAGVFREATPAPAWARLEELEADAAVVAHAQHDLAHVGAHGLAQVGHGVDERHLGGQEGVRRVLDGLGRRRVGDDHGRLNALEQGRHSARSGLVLAADHDAVWVQEVVDGRSLAQELGVGRHRDVVTAEGLLDDARRPDWNGRFVHHHAFRRQHRRNGGRRLTDVAEVG